MKKKFIITSIFTSALILSGCSTEDLTTNDNTTEDVSINSQTEEVSVNKINNNLNTYLYSSYKDLYELISNNTSIKPQEVVDFFSKDKTNNEEISFEDKRNDNGDIEQLVFSSGINILTVSYVDNIVDSIKLSFENDSKSMSNRFSTDNNSINTISRRFNTGEQQTQYINQFNNTEAEKLYQNLLSELVKNESLEISTMESLLNYKFVDSDIEETEKTFTEEASTTYNYRINNQECISIYTSNNNVMSINYELIPMEENREANYTYHVYYTEAFRQSNKNSSENYTTPKAITVRHCKDIDSQINTSSTLFN